MEGRIGNAKQAYSLNQIKAKLKNTSQTWIAATIFVMNLSKFADNLNATFWGSPNYLNIGLADFFIDYTSILNI